MVDAPDLFDHSWRTLLIDAINRAGIQLPQVCYHPQFGPFSRLGPPQPARCLTGVDCNVRLSKIAAVGSSCRPSRSRRMRRRSRVIASFTPAAIHLLRLLIDDRPGRDVVGHHPPGLTASYDVTHAVEDLAQVMLPLRGILAQQRQVRRDEVQLLVRDITRIRLPCHTDCTAESSRSSEHALGRQGWQACVLANSRKHV